MKISQLANKFNLSTNTIRYYINIGLLIPASKNKQYTFNAQNITDLELILKLKNFKFHINEIHEIISLIRVTNLASKEDVTDYLCFLEKQKSQLLLEEQCLQTAILSLQEEIKNTSSIISKTENSTGIPLVFLPYLYCPHCDIPLILEDALIKSGQILTGKLFCICGYHAEIIKGILITDGRNISQYDYPDLDRKFYKDLPAPLVSLFQKSYNWMFQQLKKQDLSGKIILENHINAYFFLYTHFDKIDPHALFVVVDKFPEMVYLYKDLIEHLGLDLKILYIADSSCNYPIKKQSVDIYIDYFSSNEYGIFNRCHLMEKIKQNFHSDTAFIGTYFSFDHNSKSMKTLKNQYCENWELNFNQSAFKNYLLAQQYKFIDESDIGYVLDSGTSQAFTFHEKNDRLLLYSYLFKHKNSHYFNLLKPKINNNNPGTKADF